MITFPQPLELNGGATGTKYWVSIIVHTSAETPVYWETTSKINSTRQTYYSTDGISWYPNNVMSDGVFTIIGDCAAVSPTEEYCTPGFNFISSITNVNFAGINNSSTDVSSAIEDFTNIKANVNKGLDYDTKLRVNTSGNYTYFFTAFIDWNQDGFLSGENEIYQLGSVTNSTGYDGKEAIGKIQIPDNVEETNFRMRIISSWQNYATAPCAYYTLGQAEDYTVAVGPKLAVQEITKSNLQIYPNPTKNIVNIKASKKANAIHIYSTDGKFLTVSNNIDTIDLSNYPNGLYLLRIMFDDGTSESKKIIKE